MASEALGKTAATRRHASTESLLRAAEQLFGRLGIDGVSLREIAAAAGHRNINAVQYHFGDKAGLVRAIYARNIPILDKRRGELLAELRARGALESLPDLVRAFLQPLVELVDEEGFHTYAAFHSQALNSPVWHISWAELAESAPVTILMVDMIGALADLRDPAIRGQRFTHATLVMVNMLTRWDAHRRTNTAGAPFPSTLVEDAFGSAIRILMPVPSHRHSRIRARGIAVPR